MADMEESRTTFLARSKEGEWEKLLKSEDKECVSDRRTIQVYLNTYELMAVSIRERVVDEAVLKAVIGDRLVRRFERAYAFIDLLRTQDGDGEYFEHFEFVAKRWRKDPSVPRRGRLRTAIMTIIGL